MRVCPSVGRSIGRSVRPSVRPSVCPSVRDAFFLDVRNPIFSTMETAGDCVWRREVKVSDNGGKEGDDERGDDEGGAHCGFKLYEINAFIS